MKNKNMHTNCASRARITGLGAMAMASLAVVATDSAAMVFQSPVTGSIQSITIDDRNDHWSAGKIIVGPSGGTNKGGQEVIIPRNLLIDLPANRLTLKEIFDLAPTQDCRDNNKTGLASDDSCAKSVTGVATIQANRVDVNGTFKLVAGEILIEKGQESIAGVVTYMNLNNGFMRVNGDPDSNSGGIIVRINDPDMVHTIQRGSAGVGCQSGVGGPNCSPDVRFGLDPENYTITFSTGYPACIPSRIQEDLGHDPQVTDRGGRSNSAGRNDPFCPHTNRQGNGGGNPVDDSTRFAPIQVGDHIVAEGNYELIGSQRFLSAHTLTVSDALTTADSPTQPDYMTFDEVEWDTTGFQNQRVRGLFIGFTSRGNANVNLFALDVNPANGENSERIIGSTRGCELAEGAAACLAQGIPPTQNGIFKIRYDVDFGAFDARRRLPCLHLNAVGLGDCSGNTLTENTRQLVPITREMRGRTDHELDPGVFTRNIQGKPATNGQYLTPVGIGHPEFVEINLEALFTPFIFTGQNWTLDRRLGPGGCNAVDCSTDTDVTLDPYPFSELDPATQTIPPGGADAFRCQILRFYGGTGGSVVNLYNAVAGTAFTCP